MLKNKYEIEDLLDIIEKLRGENGCPWDKVQTHESIKKSLIEETYEVLEAIDNRDDKAFKNELGDVLLQVAFHSVMAKERDAFSFEDVLYEICTKLITRHTYVFGEQKADSVDNALSVWEENKKKEKGQKTCTEVLKDVPKHFPALMRAQKVQKKASAFGFDWDNIDGAFDKMYEEIEELKEARDKKSAVEIEEEFGDLLFSVVNIARFLKVDSELSLGTATEKFVSRFEKMEILSNEDGKEFSSLSPKEMDILWKKAKGK